MKPKDKVKSGSPGWLFKLCPTQGLCLAKEKGGRDWKSGLVCPCLGTESGGLEVVAGIAFFYCVQRQYWEPVGS